MFIGIEDIGLLLHGGAQSSVRIFVWTQTRNPSTGRSLGPLPTCDSLHGPALSSVRLYGVTALATTSSYGHQRCCGTEPPYGQHVVKILNHCISECRAPEPLQLREY